MSFAATPRPAWSLRQLLLVLAAGLIATAPFLNKAFHIDDVLYLRVASQILKTPLDPYRGEVLWDAPDGQPASLFATDFNPPLWKYVLAGAIRIGGRDEWQLHLVESAAVIGAALGMWMVARRLVRQPLVPVVLVLWGPFFLPGQNIMLEGPMLCLCAWMVEFLFCSWENPRGRWIFLAGTFAAAAVLTKYTSGVLIAILAVASCSIRPRSLWFLVVPALALAAWSAHNIVYYGQPHLGQHSVLPPVTELWSRGVSTFRLLGGVTVFGPVLLWLLVRRGLVGAVLAFLCLCMAIMVVYLDIQAATRLFRGGFSWNITPLQEAHYWLFTGNGVATVAGVVALSGLDVAAGRRRLFPLDFDSMLEAWFLAFAVFSTVCVPFQAVRHSLLGLWALTLLVCRHMERAELCPMWSRGLVIASTLLGFGVASADYVFANAYRQFAQTTLRRQIQSGQRVWFFGNWGFVFYASQEGAMPVLNEPERYGFPPFAAGDRVVSPKLISWRFFPPDGFPPVRAVEHLQWSTTHPIRSIAPNVNYYAAGHCSFPWQVLIEPPSEEETAAWFQFPNLEDVVIYEVQMGPPARVPSSPP